MSFNIHTTLNFIFLFDLDKTNIYVVEINKYHLNEKNSINNIFDKKTRHVMIFLTLDFNFSNLKNSLEILSLPEKLKKT